MYGGKKYKTFTLIYKLLAQVAPQIFSSSYFTRFWSVDLYTIS